MKEPLVEILVRYFYEDETLMRSELGRAIASINEQTYKNLVVTFYRDGGLDAYPIIKEGCSVDWRTIGGSQNMGRGFATNCLLTTLRGDYFGLLDSDDHIEQGYVARCVEMALANGLVMIKPKVKLVYFKVEREKTELFEMYFKHQFESGDMASGRSGFVEDTRAEVAEYYKTSELNLIEKRTDPAGLPPPWLGIPPALEVYRQGGIGDSSLAPTEPGVEPVFGVAGCL